MIEFLAMAFLVAEPTAVADGGADGGTRPPMLGSVALRDPVEITAGLVTGGRDSTTFTGNVQVKHRTMDLRCQKMTAFYTASREVTRVECTGGVEAQDGDRYARGDRAEYNVSSGVLVVTGSPEARQGATYMTGTKVRLTLGSERVEVENARIVVETAPKAPLPRGKPAPKKP
ncbi:LptA/OstA family protein [Stigmatella sp. ncwal1]|uniref:LptA/OstA family protein n=1 Tax=Stigmatella ashevillensis TaxID=2995309 RepID=A0ABT5DI97_9BACT|nr:LptA/OstA family protein [Stigmatella ashevillena]MDC0713380.1 LptA/OstA family protein [Stigmatella ashevillena]